MLRLRYLLHLEICEILILTESRLTTKLTCAVLFLKENSCPKECLEVLCRAHINFLCKSKHECSVVEALSDTIRSEWLIIY